MEHCTLSQARYGLASSSIGEVVAFGGGSNGSTYYSVVDMLNVTSNTWFIVNLSQPRYLLASTLSTNKIFFGGGQNDSTGFFDVVDIFEIPLPPPSPPQTPLPISISIPILSPPPPQQILPISQPISLSTNTTGLFVFLFVMTIFQSKTKHSVIIS
jgi:hypothetical protein